MAWRVWTEKNGDDGVTECLDLKNMSWKPKCIMKSMKDSFCQHKEEMYRAIAQINQTGYRSDCPNLMSSWILVEWCWIHKCSDSWNKRIQHKIKTTAKIWRKISPENNHNIFKNAFKCNRISINECRKLINVFYVRTFDINSQLIHYLSSQLSFHVCSPQRLIPA